MEISGKTYTIEEQNGKIQDDQKTITIKQDITKTHIEKITVAQLKKEHENILKNIEQQKSKANEIVDRLSLINNNIIEVKNIPNKIGT